MKILCNRNKLSKKRIMSSSNSNATPSVTPEEQQHILKLFRMNDVDVLETYEDTSYEDGITFNEFVVVTDNTNQIRLGHLLDDLRDLDRSYDIGQQNEGNDNGFYGKDYHFYHYSD